MITNTELQPQKQVAELSVSTVQCPPPLDLSGWPCLYVADCRHAHSSCTQAWMVQNDHLAVAAPQSSGTFPCFTRAAHCKLQCLDVVCDCTILVQVVQASLGEHESNTNSYDQPQIYPIRNPILNKAIQ